MLESAQTLTVVSVTRSGRMRIPGGPGTFAISDAELAALREDMILCRRVRVARWFEQWGRELRSADPTHPRTAAMIAYLAQWVDAAPSLVEPLRQLLESVPSSGRARLPIRGYLFLRFAEGILNFAEGKPDEGNLEFVITVASSAGSGCEELILLCHLWKAELERKKGALDSAAFHASKSGELASQWGFPRLAAKARLLEGLVTLDAGSPQAVQTLRMAEKEFEDTEDWLWQGRIQLGIGRCLLDESRFQSAIEHFSNAVKYFGGGREPHLELGWACVWMARAHRLIASRLAGSIDATAKFHRGSPRPGTCSSSSLSRQHLQQVRDRSFAALAQAASVFTSLHHAQDLDWVCLERATLWADCGDLQQAGQSAKESFSGAAHRNDRLLMANARLLQSRIEKTHCDEGVGLDLASNAQRSDEYAREALALALECDARPSVKHRLLASIYVFRGSLLLGEFFNNPAASRECCRSASEYVNPTQKNELWDEYQALLSKALYAESVDPKLRKWCEGMADGKTFQQITEEFADLVIPAVWAREGKNTARVVAKLAISPKKVRRILTRVGLKD